MTLSTQETADFATRQWPLTFRTSAGGPDDTPVCILHDFYIPVLRMSVAYDRVAGYFRSSSLAAASQGFSAFTRSGGAMRLVVGADLEAHDVQAILDGDAQQLAGQLNQALGEPASWPDDVCRGVTLLAWMVAHGFLEVRVADHELEAYCNELTTQITRHVKSRAARTSLGFYLSFLRLRFASSLFAITETFRRRLDRVTRTLNYQMDLPLDDELLDMDGMDWEDEEDDRFIKTLLKNRTQADLEWEQARLSRLMDTCRQLTGTPSKMQALLEILEKRRTPAGRMKQTVVFTRFYDTLSDIVARLRKVDRSILLGTYSGKGGQYANPDTRQLKTVHREDIKQRFLRGDIDLLICTDAAAEGLNLQTADLLINFDLPWNPMKVEQRIGRIDRIGQTHDTIHVLNLCYVNSAEEIVYDRLLRRLAQAAGVVGTQQVSMLPVYEEDFRKLAAGEIQEEQLERLARKRIKRQKELTQSMEIPPKDLYDIYDRLNKQYARTASPVGLDAFWQAVAGSRYLKDLGCQTLDAEADRMICLSGIDEIIDGTLMTFSRKVYEEHPREENRTLAFGTHETDNFHQVVSGRYQLLEERDQLTIPNLPVPVLQKIAPDLLFSIRVPQLGDTMTWTAPIFVVTGAVDAAVRLADAMKAKRSELTVGAVRSRIQREIGHL